MLKLTRFIVKRENSWNKIYFALTKFTLINRVHGDFFFKAFESVRVYDLVYTGFLCKNIKTSRKIKTLYQKIYANIVENLNYKMCTETYTTQGFILKFILYHMDGLCFAICVGQLATSSISLNIFFVPFIFFFLCFIFGSLVFRIVVTTFNVHIFSHICVIWIFYYYYFIIFSVMCCYIMLVSSFACLETYLYSLCKCASSTKVNHIFVF